MHLRLGSMWKRVRASNLVPGIFTPFAMAICSGMRYCQISAVDEPRPWELI